MIIGETPLQLNLMIEFVIVDTPSAYNVILGRPFLAKIRGVLSIYHNVLKFLVGTQGGQVRGDQQVARNCYMVSANPTGTSQTVRAWGTSSQLEVPYLIKNGGTKRGL